MTQCLPPNLLALFAPRDPIPFLPPIEKHAHHRKLPYTGIAQFLNEFEDPSETPAPVRIETREERKERKRREKQEQANYKLEQDLALWNPKKNPNATSNPYNTMFVARMNYDTSESKLRRECELYGRVNQIVMVKNQLNGKPRGYAFVEFEHEREMHAAVKSLNGKKLDGMRILTDIERGRTRPEWRPRRLGKGLGKNRQGPGEKPLKSSSRHENGRDSSDHRSSHSRTTAGYSRDKDSGHRHRSRSRDRDRRRSRSRDRYKRHRSPDSDRNYKRGRDKRDRGEDMIRQYGEYGAEIRAEYNGGM